MKHQKQAILLVKRFILDSKQSMLRSESKVNKCLNCTHVASLLREIVFIPTQETNPCSFEESIYQAWAQF